ncbi:MAG TPA: hypothetical protein VFO34_09300 [Candidatus Acidoferrales bacterium]|nr:hypothetical protein [Candidatus Acidoferrales bacterium]
MKTRLIPVAALAVTSLAAIALLSVGSGAVRSDEESFEFRPETLVLSRSVYEGTASTVTVGQTLPPGCAAKTVAVPLIAGGTTNVKVTCGAAVSDGEYPNLNNSNNVWNNDGPDASFGVTSPIFLDNITEDGDPLGTLPIPTNLVVTSFSSKSELALNLADDGRTITFVGYHGGPGFVTGPNQLDVSNSNTPGVVDPTNPVQSSYFRAVIEVDSRGHIMRTDGNAYSGNNGRAAGKANGNYYMAGNDNNGGLSKTQLTTTQVGINLITSTGNEFLVPGQNPPTPPNINMIGDFEVTQLGEGFPPDKAGKDNNFRGLRIFNNTLFVTKGSGGNGVNTVYQVGDGGTLPTPANAPGSNLKNVPITILPGFPTNLASGLDAAGNPSGIPVQFPFGIFFANDHTLYVCDEGDGTLVEPREVNGQMNVASDAALATAGLQKWTLSNADGKWHMIYVLQNGLNIGVPYSVEDYPESLNPATGGCRNLAGRTDGNGNVVLFAVTSTISANGDQGADPNKLVRVVDHLGSTTLPTANGNGQGEKWGVFTTIRAAKAGEVLRGVAFAPKEHGNN